MSTRKILYAGDTALAGAASYLAGILTHYRLAFDYLSSAEPMAPTLARESYSLYILSDYPVKNFTPTDLAELVERVRGGAGLLMIGGWESFHGAAGEYHNTPLADALPVAVQASDDRVNCAQPCLIEKAADHPILAGLPFDRPPGVGGFNRVTAKPGSETVLLARRLAVRLSDGGRFRFVKGEAVPLLVLGKFGRGRTAAFTSDVAPHWVGGLVDWGERRITAQAPGGHEVEVGNCYAEFFARLVRWIMKDF